MSSELRSKKLRGSGGFVVASVTDEQQVKGNLGGPDLFLAPIGRLDSEKISKYFCNTCDKDYEDSPKIEFETPNEEVAENLILVERGQYICNACNTTIAEYREFKKPNEAEDVGHAKPIEPQAAQPEPAAAAQAAQPEPAAAAQAAQPEPAAAAQAAQPEPAAAAQAAQPEPAAAAQAAQPEPAAAAQAAQPEPAAAAQAAQPEPAAAAQAAQPEPAAAAQAAQPEPAAAAQAAQPSPSNIDTIEGRAVYDETANKIGVARRIGIDSTQSMVLAITKNDGTEMHVPWSNVKKIGEIILVGESKPDVQPGTCTGCGFANKDGAKFCEECGIKL